MEEKPYPVHLERRRTTKRGLNLYLRPIKPGDAPRYKAFLQSLSDQSVYLKFFRLIQTTDEFVERLVHVDYSRRMLILAFLEDDEEKGVLGMSRYILQGGESMAEVYFAVRDDYQNQGIGRELLSHLVWVARERGLRGFTAQVMVDNRRMLHLFRSLEGEEFKIRRRLDAGIFTLDMEFLPASGT